jgi:hypothetical protein
MAECWVVKTAANWAVSKAVLRAACLAAMKAELTVDSMDIWWAESRVGPMVGSMDACLVDRKVASKAGCSVAPMAVYSVGLTALNLAE